MRVLILTTEYLPKIGGSEVAIANLTRRLPEVTFDIISSGWGGKWLMPITGFFRGLRRDYDVIHAWQASYAAGAGVLLKLVRPKTPFVVTLQEGKDLGKQSFFVRFFRSFILRKADAITAISNYLLEYGRRVNTHAGYYLLPNGVDVGKFENQISKIKIQEKILITVSRLVPKNGLDILIYAMQSLPEYELRIAGEGPQEKELKMLVRRLNMSDRVSFLGTVSQEALPGLLQRSSVFVRPSRSEGLGVAFLEAMAAGVPVIATPVGGIPDFLKDHETGLFCRVNDPESIARAVRELDQRPELREKIVANARELMRTCYDWDILAKQYYEIISHHSGI
ncbi:MAG: glycosyltransferase family 4 protein [Patescibacteria group bacterium]